MRILIADDEDDLTNALKAMLTVEHYSVDVVNNGQDALDYALSENYDGIVLDIMMPMMDGLTVLSTLREKGIPTPVLLLTAKSEIRDRIQGLDAGADDYLPKPFAPGEFVARVRALTRRSGTFVAKQLSIGNIALDCTTFDLRCGDNTIRLGNKEFQMIEMLMRQQGRFISTEQFMDRIWGYESQSEQNVVWAYISYLRKKLNAIGSNVRISASRGRGYILEVEI